MYTFEIKNSRDLLRKLEEDVVLFRDDELSSSKAINCCMSAWHLTDWVHEERVPNSSKKARREFQRQVCAAHPSMQIMSDVANGAKHLRIDGAGVVCGSELHQGAFDHRDHSDDHDISCLLVKFKDGSPDVMILKVIEEILAYWKQELV